MEWQPIETAPRDGTEILAWLQDEDDLRGEFSSHPRPSPAWMEVISWDGRVWVDVLGHVLPEFATHWMPLPEAPKEPA